MRSWYRSRWQTTKLGTVLATIHFGILALLVGGVAISPSRDWYWWPIVPFVLDIPISFLIEASSGLIVHSITALPHARLEGWLLSQREPFCSFDLFWLPAVLFTVFGTLWHYYWPQLPRLLLSRARSHPSPPPAA